MDCPTPLREMPFGRIQRDELTPQQLKEREQRGQAKRQRLLAEKEAVSQRQQQKAALERKAVQDKAAVQRKQQGEVVIAVMQRQQAVQDRIKAKEKKAKEQAAKEAAAR